ncbi:hypothetical protein CYMTET_33559, partial [Cymbomonas tetramitiformis]
IRYMVGTAAAVARGLLPVEFVRAAMAKPARVSLPRAPPHTLVLVDAEFFPPKLPSGSKHEPGVRPSVVISSEGDVARAAFREEQLLPALTAQLLHPDWSEWNEQLEANLPSQEEVDGVVARSAQWEAECIERRKEQAKEEQQMEEEAEGNLQLK